MRVFALLLILIACGPAHADSEDACQRPGEVCSATFEFHGTCVAQEMWNRWTVQSIYPTPDYVIRPFVDYPIRIIGYELMRSQPDPNGTPDQVALSRQLNREGSWFMIGSTLHPDAVLRLFPGETGARTAWPPGAFQRWPARQQAEPIVLRRNDNGEVIAADGDLLALHGLCYGGGTISVTLTIYHTRD